MKVAAYWSRKPPPPEVLEDLCAGAEIVIVRPVTPPWSCPGVIILSGEHFAQEGAGELSRGPEGWRVQWVQRTRGHRPWTWSAATLDEGA
ncbi:MAG TPA: hypothetical protein PKA17_08185 [Phenylobacterium sp.]|nr:hypothetical protein [Phenylobacterium sp.]